VTAQRPTALIAEDEPLLRESLEQQLSLVWPQLAVVARARNGREAIEQFDAHHPDVCFLDVHMPGVTGIEAARHIGHRAHLVFVTAYDQYAVQAFAQGVLDYLVKPVDAARLAQTAARLQERLRTAMAAVNTDSAAATACGDTGAADRVRAAAMDPRFCGADRHAHSGAGRRLLARRGEVHTGHVA
jgi:DNA-binding LytR/AlgR family response regulator